MSNKDIYKKVDCVVCGKPATGFHYGATTCEACKVFFRRTVGKDLPSSPLCTGSCVATAHPETGRMSFTCPLCRLNKCLQAGMKRHDGKRGRYSYQMKSECILKARQDAHAEGTASSTTTSMACQEIPTRGQDYNPSCTETSAQSCVTFDNNSSCHGNQLELNDHQVPMTTDELHILDLNEIEQDLKNLNDNTQDSLKLLTDKLDLKENVRDLLDEAWDHLESENKETPCGDSFFESNNEFTQSSYYGSQMEQLGAEARRAYPPWKFFAPPMSVEHLGLSTTFPTVPQGGHTKPDLQCSLAAQSTRTETGGEHPGSVYTSNNNTEDPLYLLVNNRDLKENVRDVLQEAWDRLEAENTDESLDPSESNNGFTQSSNHGRMMEQSGVEAEREFPGLTFFPPATSSEHPGGCRPPDVGPSTTFTAATQGSHPEPHPQCSTGAQTSGTETGWELPGTVHSSKYQDATFERNRNYKSTETTEELDMQITRALERVDLRFNQFMTQNVKRGTPDSTVESQGRSAQTAPRCETGDVGKDSANSGLTHDETETM